MVKGWLGLALLALPSYCQPAIAQSGAHGDGHAQHHEEYQQWKQANGASCCSDADCRPVRSQPGALGWEALVEGQWLAREQYLRLKREQHKSTHPTLGVVWPQRFDPYCGPWLSNLRWKELQAWRERRDRRALTKLALTKADAFSQQLDELMLQHEQGPDRPRYGDQHEEA